MLGPGAPRNIAQDSLDVDSVVTRPAHSYFPHIFQETCFSETYVQHLSRIAKTESNLLFCLQASIS